MKMNTKAVLLWICGALLLLASLYSLNIATYNWFAADFHNQYSHDFASRGNIFFFLALALFAAFVLVVTAIFRSARKRRVVKT
jgi:TRAP-type C4-dicarboxylate transport system permease small subunit